MRRGRTIAGILILGLAGVFVVWKLVDSAEPEYQGKPLSYWVLANARPTDSRQINPAVAIAEMGTNAAPYLIKWMGRKPGNWQKQLRTYRNGNPKLRKFIPFWATGLDQENRAIAALAAMQCLGPAGRSAIPPLAILANNPTNYSESDLALAALYKIGPEAIPALLTVATNQQLKTRYAAISHLGKLRNASALPVLIGCLEDPDPSIAGAAAKAVGTIQQQPATAVPALVKVLEREPRDPRVYLHSATIWALKEFGTNADAAVFQLQLELGKTSENNYQVVNELISALASVSAQPETIVPSLTPFLESTNEHLRQQVVYSLSAMGGRAQVALPSLTNALQFPRTRHVVEFAIRKISSDVGTNSAAEVPATGR